MAREAKRRIRRLVPAGIFLVLLAAAGWALLAWDGNSFDTASAAAADWRSDWAVEPGFHLEVDSSGYSLPTAIAFVPHPGTGPKDPLYFVTELRGDIKVVTNDRTVYDFAHVTTVDPAEEAPAGEGQVGLAAVCLDPSRGYVFVTYAYQDADDLLRNDMVRFQSSPGTFSLKPQGRRDFRDVFKPYEAGAAHQIGACLVQNHSVFVSVGDGWNPSAAQDQSLLLGKVLRMTEDGEPYPGNPFPRGKGGAPYVWSYGLRNPFGLKAVDGQLFATENGQHVDAFLRIDRARNYHWDGQDWSIGIGADALFSPAFSPVQLDYDGGDTKVLPPKYRQHFFFAVAGADPFTPAAEARAGIVTFPYDFDHMRVADTPRYFLQYRGNGQQLVVGLALGPDALYFVPLLPQTGGQSSVVKMTYDPSDENPFVLGRDQGALALMEDKGCLSCHQLAGQGGTAGPTLDPFSLTNQLESRVLAPDYGDVVNSLPEAEPEVEKARQAVLAATPATRIHEWVKNQILTPGFDNPSSQMPDLGLTEAQAEEIADFLAPGDTENRGFLSRAAHRVFGAQITKKEIGGGAFVGGALFVLGLLVIWWLVRRLMRRAGARSAA